MEQRSSHSKSTLAWLLQSTLGILLIILLGIHLTVNHWIAPDGLLSYADVIAYYDVPGIAPLEVIFLVVVTAHCLMGVHAILADLALSTITMKIFTWLLIVFGMLIIVYGVRLTWIVVALPL